MKALHDCLTRRPAAVDAVAVLKFSVFVAPDWIIEEIANNFSAVVKKDYYFARTRYLWKIGFDTHLEYDPFVDERFTWLQGYECALFEHTHSSICSRNHRLFQLFSFFKKKLF